MSSLITRTAAVVLASFAVSTAVGTDRTYFVVDYPALENSGDTVGSHYAVSGTITTDGTIGKITAADIVGCDVVVLLDDTLFGEKQTTLFQSLSGSAALSATASNLSLGSAGNLSLFAPDPPDGIPGISSDLLLWSKPPYTPPYGGQPAVYGLYETALGGVDWLWDDLGTSPSDPFVASGYEIAKALEGDANGDGNVDINDLTVVLNNFGKTGMTWSQGEFTGDGTVDINDLTIVLSNFGTTTGTSLAAVPEPTAFVLVGVAVACLLAWRRRSSRP